MPIKWTEDALRAEAAKYQTKSEFEKGNNSAYNTMLKRHKNLIDNCFNNQKRPNGYWHNEARLRETAKQFRTKSEFQKNNPGAYDAMVRNFRYLLDELFVNQYQYWTEQSLLEAAKQFKTKSEFQNENGSAYHAMLTRFPELLNKCFINQYQAWDEQSLREVAKPYKNKAQFKKNNHAAYLAMTRRYSHLLDELFVNQRQSWDEQSLLEAAKPFKTKAEFKKNNHAAYLAMWKHFQHLLDNLFTNQSSYNLDTMYFYNTQEDPFLYKVGITSKHMRTERIQKVCKKGGFTPNIIRLVQVNHARKLEKTLLQHGVIPQFDNAFDGSTEFRILTPAEERTICALIDAETIRSSTLPA